MKLLILFLFLTLELLSQAQLKFKTFESDFKQNITNPNGKIISYDGSIVATNENLFLWRYTTPIIKEVYILDNKVIINEPELEQTIYTNLNQELNLNIILNEAQKLDSDLYISQIGGKKYTLEFKDDILNTIAYKDELDNSVKIYFTNQKKDSQIDSKIFLFEQNPDFDIIKR